MELLGDYDESKEFNTKESLRKLFEMYLEAVSQNEGKGCLVIYCNREYGRNRIEKGFQTNVFLDLETQVENK